MRTVELSDEVFARAERAAAEQGLPVDQWVERLVEGGVPAPVRPTGKRVQFPIFESRAPGASKITKAMIDQAELEDDMARSGLFE